jgi:hypothetical protein
MASISKIYFHILNTEIQRQHTLPWFQRFMFRHTPKKTIFMKALAQMSDLDIAKITQDALGYSLPHFEQKSHVTHDASLQKGKGKYMKRSQRLRCSAAATSNRHLNTAGSVTEACSEAVFELQEVVVHGTSDSKTGVLHKTMQDCLISHRTVHNGSAPSSPTKNRSIKTTSAASAHKHGNKSIIKTIQQAEPVVCSGIDLGHIVRERCRMHATADETHLSLVREMAAAGSIPQPPPRLRNCPRVIRADNSNTLIASTNFSVCDVPPAASTAGSSEFAPSVSAVSRHHLERPIPESHRTHGSVHDPIVLFRPRELKAASASGSGHRSVDTICRPQHIEVPTLRLSAVDERKIVSASHLDKEEMPSSIRSRDVANKRVSASSNTQNSANHGASAAAVRLPVGSSTTSISISLHSPDPGQGKYTEAVSAQPSKKRSSKRKSGAQSAARWDQAIKTKEKFGDCYDLC